MSTVLIVDDDAALRGALARELGTQGYEVLTAPSVGDAAAVLGSRRIDVMLTDLRMNEHDGIDLLTRARASSPRTRCILMSAYATARDYETALELGVVRVLCKPFGPSDMLAAVRQAVECETGFRGSVHGLSLLDLLQIFHLGRRTLTVALSGLEKARVHLCEGEIVHAEVGTLRGSEALAALLAADSGSITTTVLSGDERSIDRPFQPLMLDLLRQLDEAQRSSQRVNGASLAPAPLTSASRPSTLPPPAYESWNKLRAFVERIGPGTRSVWLDEGQALAHPPSGELDAAALDSAIEGVFSAAAQLADAPAIERIECLHEDGGVAIFRMGGGGRLVVSDDQGGRYATLRFRAVVGRITGFMDHGTNQ